MNNEKPINFLVQGNIGAGKSTFLEKLQELDFNVNVIQQPVQIWTSYQDHNYLQLFYDNPRQWTFPFQQLAINTAASEYKANQQNTGLNFFERSIYSPLKIFAQQQFITGSLSQAEMDLHQQITSDIMSWIDYDIKGIIYVRTSPQVAQKRVVERARKEDSTIPLEYLSALHKLHDEWLLKSTSIPVLVYNNDSRATVDKFEELKDTLTEWVKNPIKNQEILPEIII